MKDSYNELYHKIRWVSLLPDIEIAISGQHRFTTDSVLLSHFAAPRPKERCVELGAGCGAVSLLWFGAGGPAPAAAYCVEIDPGAAALLGQSIGRNGLLDRVFPLCADLRNLKSHKALQPGGFDLVVCNPPYFPPGPEDRKTDPARARARQEVAATIGEVAACAARLLRFGGRFCCCWRPGRLPDLFEALRANGLEPKKLRTAAARAGQAPSLLLIEAVRGGKKELRWLPPLVLYGEDGEPGEEYRAIYRMGG